MLTDEQIKTLRQQGKVKIYKHGTYKLKKSREQSYNGFTGQYTKPQFEYRVVFEPALDFKRKINNV